MSSFKRGDDEKMPVLKNKTQGNYVNVYKGIAMDPALSLRDRGMMLTLLSLPDNWDFTTAGLRKILPDGKHSIKSSIDSLQGFGYLSKEQSRGEGGVFGENVIEVYETPHSPFPDFRVSDNPATVKPVAENRSQLNNKKVTNKKSNNKGLNNQSIYQESEPDGIDTMEAYTDIIKENIEYEYLLRDNSYQKDVIEEILNLIVETVSVKRKTVRIAGADYPYEAVKGKFLKLDMGNIQYVLDCMDKNTRVLVQDKTDDDYSGITFPGGHVERGESFTDAVIREVWEETGLKISEPKLCGIKDWMKDEETRYIVLLYKTDKFEGIVTSSEEGDCLCGGDCGEGGGVCVM